MKKLNNFAFLIDEKLNLLKIFIDNIEYKNCALCGKFFEVRGSNNKYCLDCSKKSNILKTNENRRQKNISKKLDSA